MSAYLFTTITDLKDHVGGGANVSIQLSSIKPTVLLAYQKHIRQWLGDAQWQDLVDNVATPSAEQAALIEQVRRPLALLTMFEYTKIGNVQMGEMGMHRLETEDRKTAFKYQENEYRDYMLHNGFEALELMLEFLETNEADYPLWQASTGYARNKALFLNTAADFRDAYSSYISRYTFEVIRPIIQDVETFALLKVLGEGQFNDLKDGILTKSLSAAETTLIQLIQRAVAHFAIELGAVRQWVQLRGNSVVVFEKLEPQGLAREGSASGQQISALLSQDNLMANRHISYIKHYLANNLATFTLYSDYLDELAAAAAEEEAAADPAPSFEDARYDGAYNFSTYTHATRKGIKRL